MGKASAGKKVSRAARTGGGRTRRGSSSWGFPAVMSLIVIVGTLLVITSRNAQEADATPPVIGDHWHAAIGFDICGELAPNPAERSDPLGIHTHNDGIVHVHPFTNRSAGDNAKLDVWFDSVGADITSTKIEIPGQETKRDGDECGGEAAEVRVKIWDTRGPADEGRIFTGDPGDIRITDNQLITIAFLPDDAEIRKPPSEPTLDNLSDVGPQTTEPAPGPVPSTPDGSTTTAPSTAPTTTAPGTSSTTAVP